MPRSPHRPGTRSQKPDSHLVVIDISKYFLLGALVALLVTIVWIMSPFIPSIVIAAVIATGFHPLHEKVLKKFKGRKSIAALLSTLFILGVILIPVSWFVSRLTQEALGIYDYVEFRVNQLLEIDIKLLPDIVKESAVGAYIENFQGEFPIQTEQIVQFATSVIQNTSQFLVNQTTNFAKELSVLVVHIFIFILSLFFFFKDGERAIHEIKDLIPLAKKYREIVFWKLRQMSRGILYGIFGAAIAQGFLGGVGFAIAGIGNAAFWGTIMAFFAIVPYIGCTVIWVPAAIVLLITQHWVAGLFLVLWGLFAVGTVDNFIKPLVIGESARIHPLMSFVTILGGIFTMGLPGLIIAPYLLSLALAFIHIYKLEYKNILDR